MPQTYEPLMGEFSIKENEHISGWDLLWKPPKSTLHVSALNLFAMSPTAAIASIKQGLLRDYGQMIEMHLSGALIPLYDEAEGWSEYMKQARATREKIEALIGMPMETHQVDFLIRHGLTPRTEPEILPYPPKH